MQVSVSPAGLFPAAHKGLTIAVTSKEILEFEKQEQGAWGWKGAAVCSGCRAASTAGWEQERCSVSPHLTWSVCRVINAEKSEFNEDQAACCQISVRRREPGLEEDEEWLILCSTQVLPPGRLCSPCCQPFAVTQGRRFRKYRIPPSVLHAHVLKPFLGCV